LSGLSGSRRKGGRGAGESELFGISEHLGMDRADRQIAAGVGGVPVKIWI